MRAGAVAEQDASNLDLLRTCAVLAVFVDHLVLTLSGPNPGSLTVPFHFLGHAGVLLFFVHTSLVLMNSMERMRLTGWPLFRRFMIRRVLRIYPLSAMVVAVVPLLQIPVFSDGRPFEWPSFQGWLANLALVQNLTASPQVLDPLWSLPLEVQMYTVLPLIFLTAAWSLRRVLVLTIVAAASIFALAWAVSAGLHMRGLTTLAFAPCFLAGVLAYALTKRIRARLPGVLWVLFVPALVWAYCLIGPAVTSGRVPLQFPISGMLSGWALCLVLGLTIPQFRQIRSPWLCQPSRVVAKYSYGIYLSHVPVFWFCFRYLDTTPFAFQCLLAAILAAALPVAAFHAIEKPFIEWGKQLSRGRGEREAAPARREFSAQWEPAFVAEIEQPAPPQSLPGLPDS